MISHCTIPLTRGLETIADGTIACHNDDYEFTVTRTMDDWIRRQGRGFLCTVEH